MRCEELRLDAILKLCLEFMDVEHLFEVVVNGEIDGLKLQLFN